MERLLIEFADLNDLLDDGLIIYPIRLNATNVTDPAPPFQMMSFLITVRVINIDGAILSWTYRHAQISFYHNPIEEKRDQVQKAETRAAQLKEAIASYIIQKTGSRQHSIQPGLINIGPKRLTLHGHLPDDLFDEPEKEEDIEPTPPTDPPQ